MCLSGKTKFYFCGKNLRTCLFVSLLTGQKIVLERFRLIGQNFWKNKSLWTSLFVCKALESDNLLFPVQSLKNIAMIADFFSQQNSTFFSCSSIQRSLISHYSCWMIQQFFFKFFFAENARYTLAKTRKI